jgi:hypothetical protein
MKIIKTFRNSIKKSLAKTVTIRFSCTILVFFAVFLAQQISLLAATAAKTVAHYKVSTRGFSIGDVTTTQRLSDEGGISTIHFETKTSVKASFLWMGYHLDTLEKGTLLKGELVSYSRKGIDNGTQVNIEGRLDNSNFRFDVREPGGTRSVIIPRNRYEYTTMECPEAHINFNDKTHVTLNILDVEKLAVVRREYHLIRTEQYTIAGKEYPCRVVDYSDPNKKARRWINWDGTAVVMYRQDSKDKNSYSVQATSVVKAL